MHNREIRTMNQHHQLCTTPRLIARSSIAHRFGRPAPPNGARSRAASSSTASRPRLPPLVVDKDQFCIDNKPTNDKVVIGKDNGLVNAVVYIFRRRGGKMEIHPDYAEALKKPVVLDNNGCSFHPHVVAVRSRPAARDQEFRPHSATTRTRSVYSTKRLRPARNPNQDFREGHARYRCR